MRGQIVILRLYHRADLSHHCVELLGLATRLGIVDDPLERKLAVHIHRVHGLVTELLSETEAELLDFVAR